MFFGNQLIYNTKDQAEGVLDKLLISAVPISFSDLPGILNGFGGIMIPAHIDKPSNSLISNLGFIPPDSTFKTAELHDLQKKSTFQKSYPYLEGCRILCSSDAHYLNDIHEPVYWIDIPENNTKEIFRFLSGA